MYWKNFLKVLISRKNYNYVSWWVLIRLIVMIIFQCIHIKNQYVVHLKWTSFYFLKKEYTPFIKAWGMKYFKGIHNCFFVHRIHWSGTTNIISYNIFFCFFFFMFDLYLACNFHIKTLSTKTWYILTALFPWIIIPPATALFKYINQILKLRFKEQLVLWIKCHIAVPLIRYFPLSLPN